MLREGVRGRTVIQSTTNGTVALNKAAPAAHVYAAALLNWPLDWMVNACFSPYSFPTGRLTLLS